MKAVKIADKIIVLKNGNVVEENINDEIFTQFQNTKISLDQYYKSKR